ncbi:hypothetical protein AAFA46_08045 [Oscillospiraceae bacterium WX1]
MKYILLDDRNRVAEIIPEENTLLPGVPIERRYPEEFLRSLIAVDDAVDVQSTWEYDFETKEFSPSKQPETPAGGYDKVLDFTRSAKIAEISAAAEVARVDVKTPYGEEHFA